MKSNNLKNLIMSLTQDIEFTYMNKPGSVCPFYRDSISVSFDGELKDYNDIDDVMKDPFYDGKSLNEISEKLIFG